MSAPSIGLAPERLGGASAWRFAYLLVQGGASLVLFGALAHVLARDAFAAAAVAQGVLVIAQAVGDFGLSQAAVTALPARIATRPERTSALVGGAAEAFVFAAGVALLLTLAAALLVPGAAALPVVLVAPAAAVTVLVAGVDGILRAQGEFRAPVMIVAASRTAAFAGIPAALVTHSASWTCAAISAGTVLGGLGAMRRLVALRRTATRAATTEFVRATIPLGLSQLFLVLATRVDTLLAGALAGLVAAATFEGTWRIYQIGQYAIGGFATAAAPFVADVLGAGRHEEALGLLRRLMVRLVLGGLIVGAVIYLGRYPLAHLLAGSLAAPIAQALPAVAVLSPLTVAGLLALYTLIAEDGQRRGVLAAYALGAAVNVGAAAALAGRYGGRGVVLGCAAGLTATNVVLLARFAGLVRGLRRAGTAGPAATGPLADLRP